MGGKWKRFSLPPPPILSYGQFGANNWFWTVVAYSEGSALKWRECACLLNKLNLTDSETINKENARDHYRLNGPLFDLLHRMLPVCVAHDQQMMSFGDTKRKIRIIRWISECFRKCKLILNALKYWQLKRKLCNFTVKPVIKKFLWALALSNFFWNFSFCPLN